MIEFFTAQSSNGQRVAIMLEECALPYRVHALDLARGEQRDAEFLQINPAGQIPAIVDPEGPDGQPFALSQSAAILLYLAEKTGRFLPADSFRRAAAYQWLMQALADVAAASGSIFLLSKLAPVKVGGERRMVRAAPAAFPASCRCAARGPRLPRRRAQHRRLRALSDLRRARIGRRVRRRSAEPHALDGDARGAPRGEPGDAGRVAQKKTATAVRAAAVRPGWCGRVT